MTQRDLFEKLSEGRFIDLSNLSVSQIGQMVADGKRTCPDCHGMCIIGVAGVIDEETGLIVVMPVPCETCDGEGEVRYQCFN